MALRGKRIVITGGAGFIGTTLARRLVDANEIVAVDNLHRDTLGGTNLAEHPNFQFVQGDVLDAEKLRELVAGATHVVHCAGIAGIDTVLESPVRTMRVNVIGTYNVLEAALSARDTVERLVDFSTSEVFGQHAFNVQEAHVTTIGSVGEARWTYAVSKLAGEHMAHGTMPSSSFRRPPSALSTSTAPGRSARGDPGVHRGGSRRARPHDPRRWLADSSVVLRR